MTRKVFRLQFSGDNYLKANKLKPNEFDPFMANRCMSLLHFPKYLQIVL